MRGLSKFNNRLEQLCRLALFVLFIVMVAVAFTQVVARYIFFSLSWSEELTRYCLVWLTFMGGALGVRKKIHVAVEAIIMFFPQEVKKIVAKTNYLLLAVFGFVLFWYGTILSIHNMKQLSPAMHIPIGIIYAALPVGGLLILFFTLELFINLSGEQGGAVK
ncbi:MAG TPA: TRAP transporter small permease [Clostridia bacterium]|nr:TRAP transporter small permease [Clostridia bacterium]